MPKLTADEVHAFLTEPGHLVRIATVDADGAPSVVPAWFTFRDDRILFTPRERSSWWAHLRREPRVAIVVDEEASPYRKVAVRGTAEILHEPGDDDAWRDVYREITLRYVPDWWGDAYLRNTHDEPRALIAVGCRLGAPGVSTWRMPVAGEDPTGIWARRYYHGDPTWT